MLAETPPQTETDIFPEKTNTSSDPPKVFGCMLLLVMLLTYEIWILVDRSQ